MAPAKTHTPRRKSALLPLFGLPLLATGILSGCGAGPLDTSTTGSLSVSGTVYGGQQPVNLATIQLYTAGTAGNGSLATPMITSTVVQTNARGFFSITGDYTCNHPTDQVYLTATGGNPGLTAGTNNSALVMMVALGNCSNLLTPGYTIAVNEITTAAAAYALAPFMTSYTNVGASSTNAVGLANAFLDAQLLANPENGAAPALASNLKTEVGKLYALGDVIAPCVNSDGTTGCSPLFTAATPNGGTAPTNTLNALLNIVKNPGQNPVGVFGCINGQAPFPTTLTAAPNDWTMSLTITGGGLAFPTAIDIDPLGNVWVADYPGALTALSPQGVPFTGSPFGTGTLAETFGLTIDTPGNIWVTNLETPSSNGSLTEFQGASGASPGAIVPNPGNSSNYYSDGTMDRPIALASDTNGDIFIAQNADSSASIYTSSGSLVAGNLASGDAGFPAAIASDSTHGFWLAGSGGATIVHVSSTYSVTSYTNCCSEPFGIATDAFGNAWTANFGDDSTTEVSPIAGVVLNKSVGGLSSPASVAVDAAQNIWLANEGDTPAGASFTELAGNADTLAVGTALSPNAGTRNTGGYGHDATLVEPHAILPDASGNIWITNYGKNSVVMFFGLATPTATPLQSVPTAP